TGRAGLGGVAISFCDFDEKPLLKDIVKFIGKEVPEVAEHPFPLMDNFPEIKVPHQRFSHRSPVRKDGFDPNTAVRKNDFTGEPSARGGRGQKPHWGAPFGQKTPRPRTRAQGKNK
ncbi:MAG: hypothetical protein RR315_00545, partial [Oscillospiraceae bacterium]